MANVIKYKTSQPTKRGLRKGNTVLGTGEENYGPTSTTGYVNGITPPDGGYVVYILSSNNDPAIYVANNDNDLIAIARTLGGGNLTVANAKTYLAGRANTWVMDSIPDNTITNNLTLDLDFSNFSTNPGSGTVIYDLSGNEHNFNLVNSPTFNSNGYLELDGINEYGYSSTLFYGNGKRMSNCSVFALVNTTFNSGTPGVWNNTNWSILDFDRSDVFTFTLNGTGEVQMSGRDNSNNYFDIVGTQQCNDGKWHYVGWTFDQANKQVKMYVDGKLDRTHTYASMGELGWGNTRYAILGDGSEDGGGNGSSRNNIYFEGKIARLQFYDSETLSLEKIKQNYYGGPIVTDGLVLAVDPSNLVSYENGSTTTYQLTGSANNGTLYNGTGYLPNNGGIWEFDGTNDYIEFTSGISTPTANLTSVTWVKLDSYLAQNSTIGIHPDGGANGGFRIYAISPTSMGVWMRNSGGGAPSISTSTNGIPLNEWTQITFVNNNGVGKIYRNGVEVVSGTFSTTPVALNNVNAWISRFSGGGYYIDGKVGSTMLYNKALTQQEVLQNYNAQKARFGK